MDINIDTSTLIALDINIDKDIDYMQITSEEYNTISFPIKTSEQDTSYLEYETAIYNEIYNDIEQEILTGKTECRLYVSITNDNISYNISCTIYTVDDEDYCCAFDVELSEQEQQTFLKNLVMQYAYTLS